MRRKGRKNVVGVESALSVKVVEAVEITAKKLIFTWNSIKS